jgi:hypothetical protein
MPRAQNMIQWRALRETIIKFIFPSSGADLILWLDGVGAKYATSCAPARRVVRASERAMLPGGHLLGGGSIFPYYEKIE